MLFGAIKPPKNADELTASLLEIAKARKRSPQEIITSIAPSKIELVNDFGEPLSTIRSLEPGVLEKIEHQKGDLKIVGNTHLPMVDFDWPDAIHPGESITIKDAGDATQRLLQHTLENPESKFRVYMTPGGVHAFDMSKRVTPREYFNDPQVAAMDPDVFYARMSKQLARAPGMAGPQEGIFWTRTSPKPQREGDFVGLYVGDIGEGIAHPASTRQLTQYHDQPIAQYQAGKEEEIKQVLAQQLATIDPRIKERWGKQLEPYGF
jgi:hypothetical protein